MQNRQWSALFNSSTQTKYTWSQLDQMSFLKKQESPLGISQGKGCSLSVGIVLNHLKHGQQTSDLLFKVWPELANEVLDQFGPVMNSNRLSSRGKGQGSVCLVYAQVYDFPPLESCRLFCPFRSMLTMRFILFRFRYLIQFWLHFQALRSIS